MTFSTFIHYILVIDPLLFLSYMFWAIIGMFLSLLLNVHGQTTRNKTLIASLWKFLFRNNYRRIFIALILILVTIRFSTQLVGLQQNAFSSFVIGLCSDHLGKIIQLKIFKFKPGN